MMTGTIRSAARQYAQANDRRAWIELTSTLGIYTISLGIAVTSAPNWIVTIPAMIISAISGLRAYMIQHDCFHHSFFSTVGLNRFWGRVLSVISMTPFETTRVIHNLHHSHVSDLDRRDTFEVPVMTLKEWQAAGPVERLQYRLFRNPIAVIFLGPFVLFGILRRFPIFGENTKYADLLLTNALIAIFGLGVWMLAGWTGVAVWVGSFYLGSLGSLISYVVHNFEDIHWGVKPDLDFETAALKGSSVLDWGWFFDLATMNIGYHDLHHLNAKIPGYKLKEAHRALEDAGLLQPKKIGFLDSIRCLRWKLYDEDQKKMVGFPSKDGVFKSLSPAG